MHMDRPDNLKKNLGHHINYLSNWPLMCHHWFPNRRASKLTFICFQLQLSSLYNVFNTWWCPKKFFSDYPPVHVYLKTDKVDLKKGLRENFFFCIFLPFSVILDFPLERPQNQRLPAFSSNYSAQCRGWKIGTENR